MTPTFPEDFVWGVATSAYQIEGAPEADGKGHSIWDRFAHTPGRIHGGDTGDVACDHYRRYPEDVALMAELGVDAYRFSIAWTRVLPDGTGAVSQAGLDFYRRLVDELLDNDIQPWPTLYHWDLPAALQHTGGWPSRATADAFAEYAHVVAGALGDRVSNWMTINEPWVAAYLGHGVGAHPPGLTSWPAYLAAAHHLLLGHGKAVAALRAAVAEPNIGIALDCRPPYPASDSAADLAAQRHFDGFRNRWFFDPVFGRGYPADMVEAYRALGRIDGEPPTFVADGDMEVIGAPLDFVGVNFYWAKVIGQGAEEADVPEIAPGAPAPDGYTEMGWAVTPAALPEFLERLHREYGPASIVITENGASYSDGPGPDGVVRDPRRIEYLQQHLAGVAAARDAGVPVDGYFQWSLMDNFEWTHGFSQRFGLVWVDHETQQRIPKQSFDWYRRLIETGEIPPVS